MFRFRRLPFQTRFKACNVCVFIGVLLLLSLLIGHLLLNSNGTFSISKQKRVLKPLQLSGKEENFKTTCRFHTCFEINDCMFDVNDKIGVYVYPQFEFITAGASDISHTYTPQLSKEYQEILKAIRSSPYYQPNASRACMFVAALDTLNQNGMRLDLMTALFNSLPGWRGGRNHLVWSMLPGSSPDFNTTPDFHYGKAMVAGGSFSRASYRMGYDISIPVFNPLTHSSKYITSAHESNRPHFLTILSHGWLSREQMIQFADSGDDVAVLEGCSTDKVAQDMYPWRRCTPNGDVLPYPDVLEHSSYCLLLPGTRYGSPDFTDAMMTGCIPVVLDDDYVLPFSEVIDWLRVSVRVWSHELGDVVGILRAIPDMMTREMREQVLYLYRRYFSSMAAITMTTLDIINERVFPMAVHSYEWWNNQQFEPSITSQFQYSYPVGMNLPAAPPTEGFTTVILTYDRVNMLFEAIKSVAKSPSLAKVLVVWNNVEKPPPPVEEWPRIKKPIQVIRSKQNKLSNRFFPYSEIQTSAVLALDDDITMLTADELEFGYKAWQEFPDRLVGFPGRVHVYDFKRHMRRYESEWLNNISLVLTGAAFYHKFYHYLYSHVMPHEIREWVDQHMNCEDIAMNFLIANFSGQPPLKVSPRKKFKCPTCSSEESLWSDPQHYQERDECINIFEKFFKGMPLQTVKFRLDPVLYKDSIEERFQSYPNMGEL